VSAVAEVGVELLVLPRFDIVDCEVAIVCSYWTGSLRKRGIESSFLVRGCNIFFTRAQREMAYVCITMEKRLTGNVSIMFP